MVFVNARENSVYRVDRNDLGATRMSANNSVSDDTDKHLNTPAAAQHDQVRLVA